MIFEMRLTLSAGGHRVGEIGEVDVDGRHFGDVVARQWGVSGLIGIDFGDIGHAIDHRGRLHPGLILLAAIVIVILTTSTPPCHLNSRTADPFPTSTASL